MISIIIIDCGKTKENCEHGKANENDHQLSSKEMKGTVQYLFHLLSNSNTELDILWQLLFQMLYENAFIVEILAVIEVMLCSTALCTIIKKL